MKARYYYLQYHALQMLSAAIRHGDLIPSEHCEQCGSKSDGRQFHGHHEDYSKPLEVIWLCESCHRLEHNRDGEYSIPRHSKKTLQVLEWFNEHPDRIDIPTRILGDMLKVSHATVWKARKLRAA